MKRKTEEKKEEDSPPAKKKKNGPRSSAWQVTVFSEDEMFYYKLREWGALVDDNFLRTSTWGGDRESEEYDRWRTVRHMSFQLELCPTTGRAHAHVLVNFRTSHALKFVQDMVAPDMKSHCEIVKSYELAHLYGTRMIGDDGIRKRAPDGTLGCSGAYSYGDCHFGAGQRTDINGAAQAIKRGMSHVDVALKHTEVFFKYPKALESFRALVNPSKQRTVQVIFVHGPPRTGKSLGVLRAFPGCFVKSSPSGVWWDGYTGQDVIVLDDVDKGWISFGDLMSWTDGLPLSVPVKGGMVPAHWDTVVMTSNTDWKAFIGLARRQSTVDALDARLSETWQVDGHDIPATKTFERPIPAPISSHNPLSQLKKRR